MVVLPMTAGAPSPDNRRHRYHDGTTSTFVMLLFVLSFIFVLLEALTIEDFFRDDLVLLLEGCIVTCGVVACVGSYIVSHARGIHVVAEEIQKPTRMKEVFLWLFGIPSMVYCGTKVVTLIHCNSVHTSSGFTKAELFYYVITVVFILVEMVYISYLSAFQFKPSLLSNVTLLCIVTGNPSVWLQYLLNDVDQHRINTTDYGNNLTNIENCVVNSTTAEFSKTIYPFISPVFLEYLLLTTTIVRDILSPSPKETFREINTYDRSLQLVPTEDENDSESVFINAAEPRHQYSTFSGQNNHQTRNTWPLLFYIVLIVYLIDGAIAFVGFLLQVIYLPGDFRIHRMIGVSEVFLKVLMLGLILFGFNRLYYETQTDVIYRPLLYGECIFLFTAFGNCIVHIISFLGSILLSNYVQLLRNTITILQDYLQVTFVLHADRCVRPCNQQRTNYIKCVCYLLAATNFGCWLNDSFFLFQFKETHINESTFKSQMYEYKIISDIIRPMAVYYRFLCGCAFYTFGKKTFSNP